MKKSLSILFVFFYMVSFAQWGEINNEEVLKYRIHYGLLTAGYVTLTTQNTNYHGKPHFHVKGVGRSSGAVRAFFKLDDIYESYIDTSTGLPSFYVRNVSEGSYRRNFASTFNHSQHSVSLYNRITGDTRVFDVPAKIQDMMSAFYYLRNIKTDSLKPGSVVRMNIWIDDETYPFLLKVVGKDIVNTKFGKIECLKIIPSVMSGRVFKDKEGVTMWVTNDANHIPVQMKAELLVGALKADLVSYSNIKHPLHVIKK
ncbi:DUF3108 domain-containing protein [Elizabethkingia sp. JS20170427COW]|uniref:DUF3108 domain-containing protein n=1 Tax=Elizabethkingia sp. JS20170427COW TaxID=2583851 RepID=UPI00111023E1|nr:DUF3108 domain-containing protein [Elizabethkingia sp. JS20170427COW]QCX54435.1 DUF3108 domain-containing protein [Elizabethkingia sp. JS20170427COW]